jgi:tetratricopeptide (TPR) repeat protein
MTPRLQGEIDKGLEKLRRHEFEEARKHFEKAAKMAPGNPDVHYLLGMLEYLQDRLDAARKKFEAALLIYPSHERSLLALGELELRQGNPTAAGQAPTLSNYMLFSVDTGSTISKPKESVQQDLP